MDLSPCNDFILVRPIVDAKSKGGIILVESEKSTHPDKGEVLAVGPGKYVNGILEPMRMKVGQTVLFQQYPNFTFTHLGQKLVFVRELQVVSVIS